MQGNPLRLDSSGDGIPDAWAYAHGLPLNQNNASGSFQGGEHTNLEAYQSGVPADPNAKYHDHDNDGIDNENDAVPDDPEINWQRTPETRYVWIEQVIGTGAKAVSRHGHILFPTTNGGSSDLLHVLWDSSTSSWVELTEVNSWSGSGFDSGNTPDVFDAEWLHIDNMNDDGMVVGRSEMIGPYNPVAWVLATAIMKWQMTGTTSDQYADPIYIVPGFEYIDPWGDLEKTLMGEAPGIAEDGTVSAMSYHTNSINTFANEWVACDAQQASHSNEMAVWATFGNDWDIQYRSGALIGAAGGLLVEHHPNIPKSILHYRNGTNTESLEGLLPNTAHVITDTDIGRTPATSESPEGRIWFSVNHDGGDVVFLEKRAGGTGAERWYTPPSMSEGAWRLNARGEAITLAKYDAQTQTTIPSRLWRNGTYSDLNTITSKPDTVTIIHAIDLASNGIILAQAEEDGVSKTGLLLPVEIVSREPDTGEEYLALNNVISDPRPDVTVVIEGAEISPDGNLSIHVSGNVRDHLSEALESDRISKLNFTVNGHFVHSKNLSYGPGQKPWTLADSQNNFDETLVIENPKPGSYEVRVETDANAAGNTGWARVAIGLARESDPSPACTAFDELSLVLSQNHSASAVDTVTVYFGNRAPQAGDAIFTESAVDSGIFSGNLVIGEQTTACTLTIGDADAFTNSVTDYIAAELSYQSGGLQKRIFMSLQESAVDSIRFYPDGFQVNGEANRIHQIVAMPGSQASSFTPLIMKMEMPESLIQATVLKILVNGNEHTLKRFTINGEEATYVVNSATDTRPKVFIPCKNDLGLKHSVTGDNIPGGVIRWELQLAGHTSLIQETLLLANSRQESGSLAAPAANTANAPSGWQQPGDTITWTDLITAYQFIYPDEISQKLLEVYLAEGHEIWLTDVMDDFNFSYYGRPGTQALIKIENDDDDVHPGIAAQYLWMGLNKSLVSKNVRDALATALNNDILEIQAIQAYKAQVGPAAAQCGVAAAELYLSGISIINEPLDWVLVVNDVSEGQYASLAAALPFISRGMVAAGKAIRIENQAGKILGRLDNPSLPALQDAALSGNLNTLGTVLDDYQLSTYIGKLISKDGGWVKVPKRETGLKDAMKRRVLKPNESFHAHHDFPWEHRAWFADHGINVNAPAFGRWVHEVDYKAWHKGAGGGEFNNFWKSFMDAEEESIGYSTIEIFAELEKCRVQFPITRIE